MGRASRVPFDVNMTAEVRAFLDDLDKNSHPSRELLMEDRTYYVRADGADSIKNDGRENTARSAFLTPNYALDFISRTVDLAGQYRVTLQLDAGTWSGDGAGNAIAIPEIVGLRSPSQLHILGDRTTPSNVTISTNNSACFTTHFYAGAWIDGFKLTNTASFPCPGILTVFGSIIWYGNINFGSVTGSCVACASKGYSNIVEDCSVTASPGVSFFDSTAAASTDGFPDDAEVGAAGVGVGAATITMVGTPNFPTAFAMATNMGLVIVGGYGSLAFSGAATGSRYLSSGNSVIETFGGGANYFPGNAPGTTTTGGIYNP